MAEGKSLCELESELLSVSASSWPPTITEEECSLSEQAMNEFKSRNYVTCLALLDSLCTTRAHDHKVLLNKAVAEYYKSNLTKANDFRLELNDISSKVNSDEVYDVTQSLLLYNLAIIHFHSKQYQAAYSVMERVIPVIIDLCKTMCPALPACTTIAGSFFPYEPTYFVCDLHVTALQPEKALAFISQIENDSVSSDAKPISSERDEGLKEDAWNSRTGGQSQDKRDSWKIVIYQYRTRCYLMLKLIKLAKSSLKVLLSSTGMTVGIMFLKSQFELVRGNCQKAARVLNSAPDLLTSQTGGTPLLVMYYNDMAVIHLNMRKPNLALHYLREAVERNTAYENEIRRIFGKESDTSDLGRGILPEWPLQSLSGSQYCPLVYNMGVTLLHCGHFQRAFDCLLETVQLYGTNPRLWLRLAECCVMVHRQSNEEDRQLSKKMEVIERSVGSGVHRKLVFGCGLAKDHVNTVESGAMPVATMEFAQLCLDNALSCLDSPNKISYDVAASINSTSSKQDGDVRTQQPSSLYVQAPPGNPLPAEEVANLRCSILALKSYVSLYHHDYLVALTYAEELLRQPRVSGAHKYLAHMYKAEALVALDCIGDAIQNLNPDNITDISVTLSAESSPSPVEKSEKNSERGNSEPPEDKRAAYPWSPKDLTQAKGIMTYNLAAAYAIRGDYEKASFYLSKSKALAGMPLPAHMYYLKIYLELMQGRRKNVQNFIKDNFGHMAVNRLL